MTLLVTSRMPRALAERIERRVTGRRTTARRAASVRLAFRAVIALTVVATVVLAIGGFRSRARAREAERQALEAHRERLRVSVQSAAEPADRRAAEGLVTSVEQLLVRLAAAPDGDVVADPLRTGLDATLRRPMLYVRGPLGAFAEPAKIAPVAATSVKDALVLCLLAPPASRAEAPVLAQAKRAYGRMLAMEDTTANVRRLHELEAGVPFLLPPFERRIAAAQDSAELSSLERAFEKAPVVEARRAVRSELLLAAFDEPGDGAGPTELDGERPHHVRVVLAEIATGTTLLRLRRHVDPGWAPTTARNQYAAGIDSRALAYDVREAAQKKR